jgi:hypothetical protein
LEESLSDFYFNAKVKILTEKKRWQDMADHKKVKRNKSREK